MEYYLKQAGVLFKGFKAFAQSISRRVCQKSLELAKAAGRPHEYLFSSQIDKEQRAREIAEKDGVDSGLVALLSCVEPCRTYFVRGNPETKQLELRLQTGKCLHYYIYLIHPLWGWMHLRLQTWFPFLVQLCINGREWLATQMDQAGLEYRRYDNAFSWLADMPQAQALMDQQLTINWSKHCNDLIRQWHPLHQEIVRPIGGQQYYWTATETEYASDVMFRDRQSLQRIFPDLVHHGICTFSAARVLRFLGKRPAPNTNSEVHSRLKHRPEGVCLKHWVDVNSLKIYDKWNNLRPEVTINDPKAFRVFRPPNDDPQGPKKWRRLRRSVADLHRRATVCRAANERYLSALAAVHHRVPLAQEAAEVCRPVHCRGRRYRALNPWTPQDAQLLTAINRGEFNIQGFRNRDLCRLLYDTTASTTERRRRMAAVSRKLSLLRAHGLIKKVHATHRYLLTTKGQRIITALLAARQADTEQLTKLAA